MTDPTGTPVWYELLTDNADAAQTFYADVIGWSVAPSGMEGIDYRIASAPDGDTVAGLMTQPPGMAGPPHWLIYLGVADVDASAAGIAAAGGAVHMPPMTLAGVGRIAMVADPQGAPFYVMKGEGEASRAFTGSDAASPGHAVWNELSAPDPDAALAFYADRFGWRQEGAMPMGDLGDYRFIHTGPLCLGAVMAVPPRGQAGWLPYFMVAEIDAAAARLTAGGGTVLQGPDPIPGGAYSLVAQDPQGVRFGLVGERR